MKNLGAKKIVVVGLPPFGCLPAVITTNPIENYLGRRCVEPYNEVAREFNKKLQHYLGTLKLQSGRDGSWFLYGDMYKTLADMIQKPDQFGMLLLILKSFFWHSYEKFGTQIDHFIM